MINYTHALRRARATVKKYTTAGNSTMAEIYQQEVNKLKLLIRVQNERLT